MALDTKQPKGYRKAWNGGQPPALSETTASLPRREWEPKCPSPFCDNKTRVPGEFCSACLAQQDRHREAMRQLRITRPTP